MEPEGSNLENQINYCIPKKKDKGTRKVTEILETKVPQQSL